MIKSRYLAFHHLIFCDKTKIYSPRNCEIYSTLITVVCAVDLKNLLFLTEILYT